MAKISVACLSVMVSLCLGSLAVGATLFEDDFNDGDGKWTLLPGAGDVSIQRTGTPEFGPNAMVLSITKGDAVAFADLPAFSDGFIEVLWRDREIADGGVDDRDADGPVFFRAQGEAFAHTYLVEHDIDIGFHFDVLSDGGGGMDPEDLIAGRRSRGRWAWIKVRAEASLLQAKVWEVGEREPREWTIELNDRSFVEGLVGLRAWSGTAEVAFIRVSDLHGPTPFSVDPSNKLAMTWAGLRTRL